MAYKEQNHHLLIEALASGLLRAIKNFLAPEEDPKNLAEQVKGMANQMITKRKDMMNKNIILGGVAGGIVGVTTALLLAPKSGSQLIKDMYKPFEPVIDKALSHSKKSSKKSTKHASNHSSSHKKGSAKTASAKKTSSSKKSSSTKKPSKKTPSVAAAVEEAKA